MFDELQLSTFSNEMASITVDKPLPDFASIAVQPVSPESEVVSYAKGQTILPMIGTGKRSIIVSAGEVIVLMNGRPVDLIEAGEYFDESIWFGAKAIAFSDCTLIMSTEMAAQQH